MGIIVYCSVFTDASDYFSLELGFRPPLDFCRPSLFSSTASVVSVSSVLWLISSSGSMGSKLGVDCGVILAVGWRFSLSGLDMLTCCNSSNIRVWQKISDCKDLID
jgi:hypothetical protein